MKKSYKLINDYNNFVIIETVLLAYVNLCLNKTREKLLWVKSKEMYFVMMPLMKDHPCFMATFLNILFLFILPSSELGIGEPPAKPSTTCFYLVLFHVMTQVYFRPLLLWRTSHWHQLMMHHSFNPSPVYISRV